MDFVKAQAYGNDFLMMTSASVADCRDLPELARQVCDRHRGIGADGLMIVTGLPDAVGMRLFNADGSHSELSGNGIRCLAAWIARKRNDSAGATVEIQTEAGLKALELLEISAPRYRFRASMGQPEGIRQETLTVAGETVTAVVLRVGNPQCVVLGPVTRTRLETIAAALAVHPFFPEGTNVELASVEAPDRVRILIWERGVGPTEASGTGACAAAVAAASFGGASRAIDVVSPGGTQRVEWTERGIWLTGWAEIVATGEWHPPSARID